MNSVELIFHFEVAEGIDLDRTAQLIRERLAALQTVKVEEVGVRPEVSRLTGAEVVAGIAAAVIIVRSSKELISEIRAMVEEVRKLLNDLKEVKKIAVEAGEELVDIAQLSDRQIGKMSD